MGGCRAGVVAGRVGRSFAWGRDWEKLRAVWV